MALSVFLAASAVLVALAQDECSVGSPSLMQSRLQPAKDSTVVSSTDASGPQTCRVLAVFLDGSRNELNKRCSWVPSTLCETNIAALYKLAREVVPSRQLTFYEPGVGWSGAGDDESYDFGVGTKKHMLNAYKWLIEKYQPCDELLVFGFSRGALSARMLQGMIHRVGLAKKGHADEAIETHFKGTNQGSKAFKASGRSQANVRVKFMGLFDAVLRSLLHPVEHSNIESFRLQLTPTVDNLAHAISLDEYRELLDTHELWTPKSTNTTQVWFMGTHSDIGGGNPNTGLAQISGGWMADQAVQAGLLLPPKWRSRPEMAINMAGDTEHEKGLDGRGSTLYGIELERTFKIATVRGPARCRAEMGKQGQKILIHQSVQDRMQLNHGWVPLQWCCSETKRAMEAAGLQYVSNDHYGVAKAAYKHKGTPAWIRLTFSQLKNAELSEHFGNPEYFLKLANWHDQSSSPPPPTAGASGGCCTTLEVFPPSGARPHVRNIGNWWWPRYKASLDFGGKEIILPYEPAVANQVMVELHEHDVITDHDFLGRAQIKYSEFGTWLDLSLGGGATLRARADPILSDKAAEAGLGGGDHAQCRWLDKSTGLSRSTMCSPSGLELDWIFGAGVGTPTSCDDVVEDTKTGAL